MDGSLRYRGRISGIASYLNEWENFPKTRMVPRPVRSFWSDRSFFIQGEKYETSHLKAADFLSLTTTIKNLEENKMKIREYIISALLIAIGFVLHAITPAFFGMKFDLLLAFMILAIMMNPSFKNCITTGLLGGILTAATTTFPGGQVANLVDKVITALVLFLLLQALQKMANSAIKATLVGFIGTLVSGSTFLLTALFVAGLPAPFPTLFLTVVLPTAVLTGLVVPILYKTSSFALRTVVDPGR